MRFSVDFSLHNVGEIISGALNDPALGVILLGFLRAVFGRAMGGEVSG